jgi:regulatory protein
MNQRIYNYSIHLLARQDYSEFKLRQKLRSKKDNLPHEVEEVIQKLNERGLLREENYRRLFIRKWMLKGEAEDKIRRRGAIEKLEFDDDEFQKISDELGFTDNDSVEKLIAKKLRSKDIPQNKEDKIKLKMKLLRFLISKGHSYDEAKHSLDKYLSEMTNPDLELP